MWQRRLQLLSQLVGIINLIDSKHGKDRSCVFIFKLLAMKLKFYYYFRFQNNFVFYLIQLKIIVDSAFKFWLVYEQSYYITCGKIYQGKNHSQKA